MTSTGSAEAPSGPGVSDAAQAPTAPPGSASAKSPSSAAEQVLAAAAALVEAFGAHDRERYFACFAPEATLVFHSTPQLLSSRAAYRELWLQWESEGLHVLSCRSLEPRVDIVGPGTAVFTHRVRTLLHGEVDELRERETIVFRHEPDGRWRAVHEHLSIDPDDQAAP